ncbi:MAG: hypothetical protein ABIK09_13505 [Pseudomonadota bacterium]
MSLRNPIILATLAAALGLGCGGDRAPWGGPGPADVPTDRSGGDAAPDVTELRAELPLELPSDATGDLPDVATELVDATPELGPEVSDTVDAGEDLPDLLDGEVCPPDCEGKECGADGCGGSCGACPGNKPYCNMGFQCEACEADCGENVCGADGCGGSCGSCPLGWLCLGGACDPPECSSDVTLFDEEFLLCNEGAIVIVDDQPDDPVTWIVMEEGALSGPCSFHFGDPVGGTYDTGDPVSATLILPWVTLPADGNPYLIRFAVRMDAEPVVAPEYPYDHDVLILRAHGDGLPEAGVVLFTSKEFLNNTGGAWVLAAASLDAYAGLTLQLRFEFDTIDSVDNAYAGIWLDDLRVGTACPLCFTADDCVDAEPCSEDLCVLYSNPGEGDFGACGHLPKVPCCVGLDPSFCEDFDPCTGDACDPATGDCTHAPLEGCEG